MSTIEVIIRQPGFADRTIPLNEGRMRLGRADDNEIVLSDVGVSRRHAQIVVRAGEVAIEDLGSGNGTYYFGHRVKSQAMRDQDEVVIDPFVLQFRIEGAQAMAIAAPQLIAPEDGPRIEIVVGNGVVGNLFPIIDGSLTMGRAEDRDVVVPDSAASRHHCHITKEGNEYVLHDNGSANGVFVNAVRVRECTLSNGDLVRIGNTEMRFVNPAVAQAATADLGNPANWARDAGAIPIEPHNNPVATVLKLDPYAADDEEEPVESGSNKGMIAAALGFLVLIVVGVVGVLLLIGVGAWFLANKPIEVVKLPSRAPTWALNTSNLDASNSDELLQQAEAAARNRDYLKTMESVYRVLLTAPDDLAALKFAAFAGEMVTVTTLEEEFMAGADAERKRIARRKSLLRDVERGNYKERISARSQLTADYRDDPVVIEVTERDPSLLNGTWTISQSQRDDERDLTRVENDVVGSRFEPATRIGRNLLNSTKYVSVRIKVREHLEKADRHFVQRVQKDWREALLMEAKGDKEAAIALFSKVLADDPNNISAKLHKERLSAK